MTGGDHEKAKGPTTLPTKTTKKVCYLGHWVSVVFVVPFIDILFLENSHD